MNKASVSKNVKYFLGYFVLQLKRSIVAFFGIATAYVIAFELFPTLEQRLPLFFSLLITYYISAYVLVPLVYRIGRLFFRPTHIPTYTKTPDGFSCDPVNISILGTEAQVKRAMKAAGWSTADPRTIKNMIRYAKAELFKNQLYPTAPFSNLLLFGRTQDLSYQIQMNGSISHRHHVRFWAVSTDDPSFANHVRFWRKRHKLGNTKSLWVGAAVYDFGLGIIRFNGQLSHSIQADTNKERDYIVKTLKDADMIKEVRTIKAGQETNTKNRVIGSTMIADGELKLCVLK